MEYSSVYKWVTMRLIRLSAPVRYAIATLALGIGWGFRTALNPFFSQFELPFITFYPAVMVSAWLGGFGPGILTTAGAAVLADYFWMDAPYTFTIRNPSDVAAIAVFVTMGMLISLSSEAWRRGQAALVESQEQLSATLAAIGDAIIATDEQGRITRLNSIAEALTGWKAAEARGKPVEEVFSIIDEESRRPADSPIRRVLKEGVTRGLEHGALLVSRDGREIPINDSAAPIRGADGRLCGAILVFRDITERRTAERAAAKLLESEHEARQQAERALTQLRGVQAVMDVAFSNLDANVLMRELLAKVRTVLGADTATLLLLNAEGHLVPTASDGLREEIHETIRIPPGHGLSGRIAESVRGVIIDDLAEVDVISSFLRQHVKSLMGAPLRISGQLFGVIHVGSASPRKFTEDELRLLSLVGDRVALAIERARLHDAEHRAKAEAETANRLKDEFIAVLSHELRTPLSSVLGWAHVLNMRGLPPERAQHAIQAIVRGAQAATQLVNSLLDLSRIMSGKLHLEMKRLDLVSVVKAAVDTVRPAADARHLALEVTLPRSPVIMTGDAARLQQIVWNLLSNATKFTPEGGRIEVRLVQTGSQAQIQVSDNGRGIRAEFLPHVFDRFAQAENKTREGHVGLGLGLAIARELVQGHGGTIQAASEGEGRGSTFTVTLPVASAATVAFEAEPPITVETAENEPITGTHVLIVDDEEDARNWLATALQPYGAAVETASSVTEALDLIRRSRPDVLLADLGMPQEDGFTLIRKLRTLEVQQQQRRIPAVAVTAYATTGDRERAIEAGYDWHVVKPFEIAEIVRIVASLKPTRLYANRRL
jgi:PAS domain S-box-containing protein